MKKSLSEPVALSHRMAKRTDPGPFTLIQPIQYLRGIAALMVVWHHGVGQLATLETYFPFRFGTSGVDLFFVISGFIMVVTTAGRDVTPTEFIARRFVRVVPLYWVLTLALAATALVAPSLFRSVKLTAVSLIQSLLFIPHFSPSHAGMIWPVLVPGWTLNYEMFFYVVFAASLAFSHRLAILSITLAMLVASGYLLGPFAHPIAQTYTDPILLEFVAGALIGRLWLAGADLPFVPSILASLVGAALLLRRDSPPLESYTQLLGAVLLVCGVLNRRILHWRNDLLRSLGDASYSIYLTHIFTLGVWRWVWARLNVGVTGLAAALAFMLLALVFASVVGWLSYRWIETPLLAWMRDRRRNRIRASTAALHDG
jgi:exopolysaccharide production protein ExoZ